MCFNSISYERLPIYVSFGVHSDRESFVEFRDEISLLGGTPSPVSIHGFSQNPSLPPDEWEEKLEEIIGSSKIFIVLIGPRAHLSESVETELIIAKYSYVPVFGIYLKPLFQNIFRQRVLLRGAGKISFAP